MRYTVRKSLIWVVGRIWMPATTICSQVITLNDYDVRNIRDEDGHITRDAVDQWLATHAGDFSSIIDFSASIEDGDQTVDIPWDTEEGEMQYLDTVVGEEE